MPRRKRVFVEGGIYHVYARITRREGIFADPAEAGAWIAAAGETKRRDGFAVLAWCLMSNHFHLMVRPAGVPLWRSLHGIQGPFATGFNRRHGFVGPVWQSRYKAKLVGNDDYLRRLIAYIHLNPVVAAVASKPEAYKYSGHREVLGRTPAHLSDPVETLRYFGETRRAALQAYRETIAALAGELSASTAPRDDVVADRMPDTALGWSAQPGLDALGRSSGRDRPVLSVEAYLNAACDILGVTLTELGSHRQHAALVRLREAIVLLGTERYGLRLNALAKGLVKSVESASRWVSAAARRRRADTEFAALFESLDAMLCDNPRVEAAQQE